MPLTLEDFQNLNDHIQSADSYKESARRSSFQLAAAILSNGGVLQWPLRNRELRAAMDAGVVGILYGTELELCECYTDGSVGPRVTSLERVSELLRDAGIEVPPC